MSAIHYLSTLVASGVVACLPVSVDLPTRTAIGMITTEVVRGGLHKVGAMSSTLSHWTFRGSQLVLPAPGEAYKCLEEYIGSHFAAHLSSASVMPLKGRTALTLRGGGYIKTPIVDTYLHHKISISIGGSSSSSPSTAKGFHRALFAHGER